MKIALLAGGRGTRLAEETSARPKPMVEIGGHPVLWHIMQIYARHGFSEFVVAAGYKGEIIKQYFSDFHLLNNDYVIDLRSGEKELLNRGDIDWKVAVIDTGLDTNTAGRLARLKRWLGNEAFMVTYGDGVADVDVSRLVEFHRQHGKLATITAVRPPARFGSLEFDGSAVTRFSEKPQAESGWINGGFFVFEPGIFDYLTDPDSVADTESLERSILDRLALDGQLMAFFHEGFWRPMDTLRDRQLLEGLWSSGKAPWKTW